MVSLHVWAPTGDVEYATRPLWTTDPITNQMGSTEVEIGYAYLVIGWSQPDENTGITVEAYEGDPEDAARRVYDHLVAITTWRLELWDEDGSHLVSERPALTTV